MRGEKNLCVAVCAVDACAVNGIAVLVHRRVDVAVVGIVAVVVVGNDFVVSCVQRMGFVEFVVDIVVVAETDAAFVDVVVVLVVLVDVADVTVAARIAALGDERVLLLFADVVAFAAVAVLTVVVVVAAVAVVADVVVVVVVGGVVVVDDPIVDARTLCFHLDDWDMR